MQDLIDLLPLAVALTFITYLVHWGLLRFLQPQRVRMFELGDELLADERLTEFHDGITRGLDRAYSPWSAPLWILAFAFVPFTLLFSKKERESMRRPLHLDAELNRKLSEFAVHRFLTVLGANWVFGLILILQAVLIALVLMASDRTANALGKFVQAISIRSEAQLLPHFGHHSH